MDRRAADELGTSPPLSVSLATVELKPAGAGTRLIFTEQAVFLDGYDNPARREEGTRTLLDNLDTSLLADLRTPEEPMVSRRAPPMRSS